MHLKHLFVLFGGNGDLAQRKLLPALYNLVYAYPSQHDFAIVAIGRRDDALDVFHQSVYHSLVKYSRFKIEESAWTLFQSKLHYQKMDFNDASAYCQLNTFLTQLEGNQTHHRIYYLAVAPEYFEPIVTHLNHICIKPTDRDRVVIEKPFGRSLASAIYLNQKIVDAFSEDRTYRIDHYLGKEMLQNIMVIRFANAIFEHIWNHEHIEQVQISSLETIGVETRGAYYEKAGAMRDMVQSHLLQLLALIAMERPQALNQDAIRSEKVKVIQAIRGFSHEAVHHQVVRGQYRTYRNETNVNPSSTTETFVAMKLMIENQRWQGVPFYIRTGKKMHKKAIEVIIEFKQNKQGLYPNLDLLPNYLVIKVQPQEGIYFQFNAKRPGTDQTIVPVKMDFCQNCQMGINSPEAYERLLLDVMRHDSTLFTRWDEIESSWTLIDSMIQTFENDAIPLDIYEVQSMGPDSANDLLARDGRHWITLEGDNE